MTITDDVRSAALTPQPNVEQLYNIAHAVSMQHTTLPKVAFTFQSDQMDSYANLSVNDSWWINTGYTVNLPVPSIKLSDIQDPDGKQIGMLTITPTNLLQQEDPDDENNFVFIK